MRTAFILLIMVVSSVGCRKEPVLNFPLVQKYQVSAGDIFYFRPGDSQYVLVERRKALAVAIAPGADVQAYAFDTRISLSRRGEHKGGDFLGAGGQPADFREMTTMTETPRPVNVLAISKDGLKLAGGSAEGGLTVWNLSSGEQVSQVTTPGPVLSLAFSPDGKQLAVGLEQSVTAPFDTVKVLDSGTGLTLGSFGNQNATALVWSNDGSRLMAGFTDGTLTFWEGTQAQTISVANSPVVALAVHPSGQYLACAQADKRVTLLKLSTNEKIYAFTSPLPADPLFPRAIEMIAFDPSGARFAVSYADGAQQIWDVGVLHNTKAN